MTRKHPFSIVSPCLMPLHHSRMIFSAAHSHSGKYGHPKLPSSCVIFQAPRRYWINSWPQSHICKNMYVQLWTNRLFHEWCSCCTEMLTSSRIVCVYWGAGVGRGPPKGEVIPWDWGVHHFLCGLNSSYYFQRTSRLLLESFTCQLPFTKNGGEKWEWTWTI